MYIHAHAQAALAAGKLSQQDAVDWLERHGHTSWSTAPTEEEKRAAKLEGLQRRGPQLRVKAEDPPAGDGESLEGQREIDFCRGDFGPRMNVVAPLQLAEIGTAQPAEFDLTGKVCVADRGGLTFVQKALIAQNAGAVALIIVNNEGGSLHMGGDGDEEQVKIPVVSVKRRDREVLVAAAAAGHPAVLNLQRHDGRPVALVKRQPPLHEVLDGLRCLDLPPALVAIRDRPERSAIRIQARVRGGFQRRSFVMLRDRCRCASLPLSPLALVFSRTHLKSPCADQDRRAGDSTRGAGFPPPAQPATDTPTVAAH